MRGTVFAYGLSYAFAAVCWANHHDLVRSSTSASPALIWSNFLFLFTMSFLPVSTAYLSAQAFSTFSVRAYALSFLPMLASYMVLETFVACGHRRDGRFPAWHRRAMARGCGALVVHTTAALVSRLSAKAAFALIVVNVLLYISPGRLVRYGEASTSS